MKRPPESGGLLTVLRRYFDWVVVSLLDEPEDG
jgi:hypothetical protein